MKIFKYVVIFLSIMATACSSHHQKNKETNVFNFNNDRVSLEIEVLFPESYSPSGHHAYPVLYVLDGFWNKGPIKTAYNDLRFDNMVPEIIIVSIGYPKNITDVEEQRMWDLTPAYDAGFKAGGNAAAMLSLLLDKVVPFVENTYRIDEQNTILTGHSLAGLFTLYAMYQNPKSFTHYAAISPSALWANKILSGIDSEFSRENHALRASVYITYGTDEYVPYVNALKRYIHQLEDQNYEELNLSLAEVNGMRHVGMKSEGFIRAMIWALQDKRPEGPSEFEKKNKQADKVINLSDEPLTTDKSKIGSLRLL